MPVEGVVETKLHANYPNPFKPETWIKLHQKPPTRATRRALARVFGILPMVFAPAKQGFHTHADYSARNDKKLK